MKANQKKATKGKEISKDSGLLLSVSKIQKARSRSEISMSDGGGTGRSDANDKNANG